MKLSELYSEYFANWISGGAMITQDKISLIGIKSFYDRFMTNTGITKVWAIEKVPVHLSCNITQMIRSEMFEKFPSVKTVIHMCNAPVSMNVHGDHFQRGLKAASRSYNDYKSVFDQLSADEKLTGLAARIPGSSQKLYVNKETLEGYKEAYDSFTYVYSASTNGQCFVRTTYFVQATARTKKELQTYSKALGDLVASKDLYMSELRGSMPLYLTGYAPAAPYKPSSDRVYPNLFSEENVAALLPNKTKGLIGHGPLMLGLDWQSKLPFWIDFFNSGSAQVVMLLARSGYGKTFLAFVLAVELAGINVHWSAIDIKGGEWIRTGKYVDVAVISMSGSNARFVNTLRLDDVECSEEDCKDFYDTAVRGTVDLFEIATNLSPTEGNVSDLRSILDTAVTKVFSSNGVMRDNPSTFGKTKDLKFADVLDVVSTLESTKTYTENQRKICKLIKVRTSPYFMGEGRYAYAFKNELTVGGVLDTPGVIYDFNKNAGEALDTLDSLRVFMVQFLDGKKHSIRRKKGLHTAAFYEELQRSRQFGKLVEAISQNVTGSRSNNLTVFLLLNAVSTFSQEGFAPIKSNITTKIIGKVIDEDLRTLVNDFDCGMIDDYIADITNDVNGAYTNCFAIQYDTGTDINKGIIRSVIPSDMVAQFETRSRMTV